MKEQKNIHNNKYNYSKVEYINSQTKVCVICSQHGEFWQTPNVHLKGCGCPYCKGWYKTTEKWIKEIKNIHGNKYDYSKVEYNGVDIKVPIICHQKNTITNKEHGIFYMTPHYHKVGNGCPKCGKNFNSLEYFIERVEILHNYKYDYSKVEYTNSNIKVPIMCSEHGIFYMTPHCHLKGRGCPKCQMRTLSKKIIKILIKLNVKYDFEKSFDWLINPETNRNLYLDFYLPDYNIAIECQGLQHFKANRQFGGENNFQKQKERDEFKYKLCKKNNIDILYFADIEERRKKFIPENYFSKIFKTEKDIEEKLNEILK